MPGNFVGNEPAHLGIGYAGVLAYYPGAPSTAEYREYLEAPLLAPLIAGRCYRISFWVSLADASQWSCDGLGARLQVGSAGPVANQEPLLLAPQVESAPGVQLDGTSGWTRIHGLVRASGGEDHILIGNFRDNASISLAATPGGNQPYSYYYVDDVAVEYSPDCPCETAFGQAIGMPGLSAPPSTLVVLDLDGLGAGLPALFAGGEFTISGGTSRVMTWNGATWSPFGPVVGPGALNGTVRALALFQGELYAAGSFTFPSTGIARWDGALQEWVGVAGGLDGGASTLQVYQGALHVGGDFLVAGGASCPHIARFDGSTWSSVGAGLDGPVRAFAVAPDVFTTALFVGGEFTSPSGGTPGSLRYIARWDGNAFGSLGGGMDAPVRALLTYNDGSTLINPRLLYAAGDFTTAGGQACARVAALEGPSSTWHPLGPPGAQGTNGPVHALAAFDPCGPAGPFLIAGGAFTSAAGTPVSNIARFALGNWADLDGGTSGPVSALATFDDGSGRELVAGGEFLHVGSTLPAARVVTWRGCYEDCGGKRRPRYIDSLWPAGAAVVACTSYGPNPSDPALQLIDLSAQSTALVGTSWSPARFENAAWSIGQLGEVYGVALDDAGDLFVAHSTVFGHPSLSQDRLGAAGIPGVVYRIDSHLTLPYVLAILPNAPDPAFPPGQFVDSYPGLGDVAWDCEHHRLFVSNFEDGIVYVLDPETGDVVDLYDHGLPDSGAPGFVARGERVWALATNVERLFYGVVGRDFSFTSSLPNEVWSVALGVEGRVLAGTARLEISLPASACPPAGLAFTPSGSLLVTTACTIGDTYLQTGGPLLEYRWIGGAWVATSGTFQPGDGTVGGIDCQWDEDPNNRVWTAASIQHTTNSDVDGPMGLPAVGGGVATSIWIDLDSDPLNAGRSPADLVVSCPQPIPVIPGSGFCAGDGTLTLCPCSNSGGPGRGCANSVEPGGASLVASGTAVLSADSFALSASGMPNGSALYFQGTAALNGGAGTVFGDGLRCAGGSVTRIATRTNVFGSSLYPGLADVSISVRGACTPGAFRTYQVWYRNAAAFCTASTFNLTNGVSVTWLP